MNNDQGTFQVGQCNLLQIRIVPAATINEAAGSLDAWSPFLRLEIEPDYPALLIGSAIHDGEIRRHA
jgi:hypothetical protein